MASLLTHFASLDAVISYLHAEGFTAADNGIWISADGLIDARVRLARHGYRVEYFA